MYKFIFADVQKCFSREFVLAEKKEKYFSAKFNFANCPYFP